MAPLIRCCALALTVLSIIPAGRAEALDCWLLSGSALDRARQQGQCRDTFARNTTDATPALPPGRDPQTAQADIAEARPPVRQDPVANALSAVQAEIERFAQDVERDLTSVGRALLKGGPSGVPSHNRPSGR